MLNLPCPSFKQKRALCRKPVLQTTPLPFREFFDTMRYFQILDLKIPGMIRLDKGQLGQGTLHPSQRIGIRYFSAIAVTRSTVRESLGMTIRLGLETTCRKLWISLLSASALSFPRTNT